MIKLYFSDIPNRFEDLISAKPGSKKPISVADKIVILRGVGLRPVNQPLNKDTVVRLDNYIQAALHPEEVFSLMDKVSKKLDDAKGRSNSNSSSIFQSLQGASLEAKTEALTQLISGNITPTTFKKDLKLSKDIDKVCFIIFLVILYFFVVYFYIFYYFTCTIYFIL
jgi:hypothetical protein